MTDQSITVLGSEEQHKAPLIKQQAEYEAARLMKQLADILKIGYIF